MIKIENLVVMCAACVLIAGCAMSSGVLKMGPGTYTISATAAPPRGGHSKAMEIALTEANQYCTQMGKEILVMNTQTVASAPFRGGSMEVTFRCLDKDDPELQRPEYRQTPNVVIEDRRK